MSVDLKHPFKILDLPLVTYQMFTHILCMQAHKNYLGRDPKIGPVLFSMVKDEDYRGTNMRLILRLVTSDPL